MYGHYNLKFQDGSEFRLSGQDYFGDRVEFSRYHNKELARFVLEVCEKRRPKSLYTSYEDKIIEFKSDEEFDNWYKEHQSKSVDFGFSDAKEMSEVEREVKKRVEEIDKLFIEEIKHLDETKEENLFRYFYERYNILVRRSKLGEKSLEQLLNNSSLDRKRLLKYRDIFSSPLLKLDDKESLEFYSGEYEKSISKNEILGLLLKHYKLFKTKIDKVSQNIEFELTDKEVIEEIEKEQKRINEFKIEIEEEFKEFFETYQIEFKVKDKNSPKYGEESLVFGNSEFDFIFLYTRYFHNHAVPLSFEGLQVKFGDDRHSFRGIVQFINHEWGNDFIDTHKELGSMKSYASFTQKYFIPFLEMENRNKRKKDYDYKTLGNFWFNEKEENINLQEKIDEEVEYIKSKLGHFFQNNGIELKETQEHQLIFGNDKYSLIFLYTKEAEYPYFLDDLFFQDSFGRVSFENIINFIETHKGNKFIIHKDEILKKASEKTTYYGRKIEKYLPTFIELEESLKTEFYKIERFLDNEEMRDTKFWYYESEETSIYERELISAIAHGYLPYNTKIKDPSKDEWIEATQLKGVKILSEQLRPWRGRVINLVIFIVVFLIYKFFKE